MNATKLLAIALIAAGGLGLAYRGFSYTSQTQEVKLGPLALSVAEKHRVNLPIWAGAAAMVAGGLLPLFGGQRG